MEWEKVMENDEWGWGSVGERRSERERERVSDRERERECGGDREN